MFEIIRKYKVGEAEKEEVMGIGDDYTLATLNNMNHPRYIGSTFAKGKAIGKKAEVKE